MTSFSTPRVKRCRAVLDSINNSYLDEVWLFLPIEGRHSRVSKFHEYVESCGPSDNSTSRARLEYRRRIPQNLREDINSVTCDRSTITSQTCATDLRNSSHATSHRHTPNYSEITWSQKHWPTFLSSRTLATSNAKFSMELSLSKKQSNFVSRTNSRREERIRGHENWILSRTPTAISTFR